MKRLQLLFALFIPICFCSLAQQNEIDSLEAVIRSKSEIERYGPLLNLAIAYYANNQNENAVKTAKEAHVIAKRSGDSTKIVHSGLVMGQLYNHAGLNKQAEKILTTVLSIARRISPEEDYPMILNNLGYACVVQAKYDKAQAYNLEALQAWQHLNDNNWIAITLHNIGLLYYKLKDNDKALRYFIEALQLKRQINDPLDVDRLLINISLCYSNNHSFAKAKVYADSASSMCPPLGCKDEVAEDLNFSFGSIYFGTHDFTRANEYFLKSLAHASKLNDIRFQLDNLTFLSDIALQQGEKKKAREFLHTGETIIGKGTSFYLEEYNIYNRLTRLYSGTDDYAKILFYQQKYANLRDLVYKAEVTNNLMKLEIDHVEQKNKNTLASQNQMLALQEISIQKQRQINLAIATIMLALATAVFLTYRNMLAKRRIGLVLERRVHERTEGIEANEKTAIQAASERNSHFRKISEEFYDSLARMNQLIKELASVNQTDSELSYAKKLGETAGELYNSLKSLENKLVDRESNDQH